MCSLVMRCPSCQAILLALGTGRMVKSASDKSARYELRRFCVELRAILIGSRAFISGSRVGIRLPISALLRVADTASRATRCGVASSQVVVGLPGAVDRDPALLPLADNSGHRIRFQAETRPDSSDPPRPNRFGNFHSRPAEQRCTPSFPV